MSREEAIKDWERDTDEERRRGRQFSGQRLKAVAKPEWLTKAAFVLGTGAVVFFVFAHDSKEDRAREREARVAAQAEEPSVRDFRPPVMPVRSMNPPPPAMAEAPREKPAATRAVADPEAAARRRQAAQLEEARTKSDLLVKGTTAAPSAVAALPALASAAGKPANEGQGPIDTNQATRRGSRRTSRRT